MDCRKPPEIKEKSNWQNGAPRPAWLALVAVGNTLRGDDGIAQALCKQLPADLFSFLSFYDLGTYTGQLPECLRGHRAAIVVDATASGQGGAGHLSIVKLREAADCKGQLELKSSHGFSLLDELSLVADREALPESITLFGVASGDSLWGEGISDELQACLPFLVKQLLALIEEKLAELDLDA